MHAATLAAHRFGYAEADQRNLGAQPREWVLRQFDSPAGFDSTGLPDGVQALRLTREALAAALQPRTETAGDATQAIDADSRRQALRQANGVALHRRWRHMATTPTPVAERWVQFWANHFCVAATKGSTAGMVWCHEMEAVRPHAFGRFADLLRAATVHPSMLLYLDNALSAGPDSPAGRRRERGLNENLARELLELHTLGVDGGYTQADVTETARVLTGWTVPPPQGFARAFAGSAWPAPGFEVNGHPGGASGFVRLLHQPGSKQVLGRSYGAGPQALDALLTDLARHPSTARHLARKLARHFVADEPPAALVADLARRFADSDGDLRVVARALFSHDATWSDAAGPKLRTPEDLLIGAHRLLRIEPDAASTAQMVGELQAMGQAIGRAPSPQGWPDRVADWLSPDALLKRVQWAERMAPRLARRHGGSIDARALARASLGDDLSDDTARQIERADSAQQALALLLASPEFQRR